MGQCAASTIAPSSGLGEIGKTGKDVRDVRIRDAGQIIPEREQAGIIAGRAYCIGVCALFGWVDRSTVAGGHAAFRFDYRIAQSHRTKRLKIKMPAGELRR